MNLPEKSQCSGEDVRGTELEAHASRFPLNSDDRTVLSLDGVVVVDNPLETHDSADPSPSRITCRLRNCFGLRQAASGASDTTCFSGAQGGTFDARAGH